MPDSKSQTTISPDDPWWRTAFRGKRVRMVRPGFIGITIAHTEYVMPTYEANELVAMINRAKHDGVQNAE